MSQRLVGLIGIVVGLTIGATLTAQAQRPAATPTATQPGRFQYSVNSGSNTVFDTQTGLIYMQVNVEGNTTALTLDLINARLNRTRIQLPPQ